MPEPLAKIFSTRLDPSEKRNRIIGLLKVVPWRKKRLRLMFEQFAAAQKDAYEKLNQKEDRLRISAFDIPLAEKLAQQERIVKKTEQMACDASLIRHRYAVAAAALADHPHSFRGADQACNDFIEGYKAIDADIRRREQQFAKPARDGAAKTKRQIRQKKKQEAQKAAVAEAENAGALARPITVGPPLKFR
jgi:hypothetical protein